MAVGLKSRFFYRVREKEFTEANYWAGTYQLIGRVKSIPSPYGDPNMVDVSTLEDLMEVQEEGRRSAVTMDLPIAFEKKYKDSLIDDEGKVLDMMIFYGTNGRGSEGISAFTGTESFRPDEATDDHLTGTISVAIKTYPSWIEDNYDVDVVEDANGTAISVTLTPKSTEKAISLDKATASVEVGATVKLNATVAPEGSTVTWASSDDTVATVNTKGLVTAVSAGTTNITATNDTVTANCAVTVVAGA